MEQRPSLLKLLGHDAFRFGGGLNKSAAEVYWTLLQESLPAKEIINRTGRSRRTVFRALERMSNIIDFGTGEILHMVEKDGSCWRVVETDLNKIALLVGTAGKSRKQIEKHNSERQSHRRYLRFLKNHKAN